MAQFEEAKKLWRLPRPDETLDDLSQSLIPMPTKVETSIPADLIGDCLSIIEFQRTFNSAFGDLVYTGEIGKKLDLSHMETILFEQTSSGLFCDMLFFYIQALRYCYANEIEESGIATSTCPIVDLQEDVDKNTPWPIDKFYDAENLGEKHTVVAQWGVKTLGYLIHDLQVDEVTVSEVIRLLILSSGADVHPQINTYRIQYRPGWTASEDNLLQSLQDAQNIAIYKKLETETVFSLNPSERLRLLMLLSDLVLSQPDGRQVFMDTEEEIRDIRKEIWSAQQVEKVRKTAFKTELGELLNKLKEDSKKEAENGDGKKEPTRDLRGGKASTEADIADCHSKNKRAEDEHQNEIEKCHVEITKLKLKFQSHYLGDDRFFRRYWIMSAFSGVVVEIPSKLPRPSDSLQLTSWENYKAPELKSKPKLRDYLSGADCPQVAETEQNGGQLNGHGLTKINGNGLVKNGDEGMDVDKTKEELEIEEEKLLEEQKMQETENWSLKPIFSGSEWYQYEKEEDIRALHAGLNIRGLREKELKINLQKMFSYLTRPHQTSYIVKKSAKKKETVQIVGFNPEVKNILSCRDYILDLEERIFNADFGDAFENEEQRTLWRSDWEVREGENKIDYLTLADPQQTTLKKMKKLPELPEKPTYSIHLSTEEEENDKILEIRNLAAAVVLLKRGMQSKTKNLAQNSVLTRPLFFASRNEKKKSKKEKGDWKNTLFLQHKQWEASILRCKSAAALYLHIVHLDECIMWAKSPENIRCSVCRKKSDGENMLICDDCEKAFHIYCLKPKLKKIPKGDWYCPKCTQERKEAESPKKKRRSTAHFSDDDSDSDEEDFNPAKKRRAAKRVNYQE